MCKFICNYIVLYVDWKVSYYCWWLYHSRSHQCQKVSHQKEIWLVINSWKNTEDLIFTQDVVLPHFAVIVRKGLNGSYPGRWMGHCGLHDWLARKPDFFLCDWLKDKSNRLNQWLLKTLKRSEEEKLCNPSHKSHCWNRLRLLTGGLGNRSRMPDVNIKS